MKPSRGTAGSEYADRLITKQRVWWKEVLDVQAPYRWNLRRLKLGYTLEIGCGIGRNLQHLRGNAVGIDHNRDSIEFARSRGLTALLPDDFTLSSHHAPAGCDSLLLAHVAGHMTINEAIDLFGTVWKRSRAQPILAWLGIAAPIKLALWVALFSTVMEIRFVLFCWMVLVMVVAEAMDAVVSGASWRGRNLISPVASAVLVIMAARELEIAVSTYSPVDGSGQAHCYECALCTFLDPLNRSAGMGDRVFVLSAFRYCLRPDLIACASRAGDYLQLESLAQDDSLAFWTELYCQAYSDVAFETNYAVFHTHFGDLPSVAGLPDWLHVSSLTSTSDGLERVYSLQATNPPELPVLFCKQDMARIWRIWPSKSPDLRSRNGD